MIKVRSNLKIKNKYIERNYSQLSNSIYTILGFLDRFWSPLSNEYKFMCIAYMYEKLLMVLSWELYLIF